MKIDRMKINVTKIQEASDRLEEAMAKIQQEFQANAKTLIGDVFGDFMRTYPFVKALYWTQFRPHFNDGEACEFSIYDLCVLMGDDIVENYIEDLCDGENTLSIAAKDFTQKSLDEANKWLEEYIEWEKDKRSYSIKKITVSDRAINRAIRKKYGYSVSCPTPEQRNEAYNNCLEQYLESYKPYYMYKSSDDVRNQISKIENNIKNYGSFGDDASAIEKAFRSIDENAMKNIYGDHSKVIITLAEDKKNVNVQIIEYDHD